MYKSKLHKYVPGGAHTYSKGDDCYPNNVPSILKKGNGCYVYDLNNKKYLDYGCALGAIILGYNNKYVNNGAIEQINNGNNLTRPSEIEYLAAKKIVDLIPWIDMVKFAKNGSNVTTAAIKLARAYTNKQYIVMCQEQPFYSFDDWFIGSTVIKRGTLYDSKCPFLKVSGSELKFNYNKIETVEKIFKKYGDNIACIIMEPCTLYLPKIYENGENFLQKLRKICDKYNSVLIFDEMVTGFRYDLKGATNLFNVIPDLVTYGKGIANGFSVSVVGGKKEIMELGDIITEGRERVFLMSSTHGAEMSSLGAMIKNIEFMEKNKVVEHIHDYGKKLKIEINKIIKKIDLNNYFSIIGDFDNRVIFKMRSKTEENSVEFRTLFVEEMCNNNIIMIGSALNLNYSHKEEELKLTVKAIEKSLEIYKNALEEGIDKYLKSEIVKGVFRKYN